MSVNGLGLNSNIYSNIDRVNVASITSEVLNPAKAQTNLAAVDLAKFTRPSLGVELYNGKISVDAQREIAIAQSGINTQNINTSFLNAQAASALYAGSNVSKNVEGKMTVNANAEMDTFKTVEAQASKVDLYQIGNLQKDSKGSNPFSYSQGETKKEEEKTESLSLIA